MARTTARTAKKKAAAKAATAGNYSDFTKSLKSMILF